MMKCCRTWVRIFSSVCAVLALTVGTLGSAHAQKTYRCGNTYQSVPCAGPTSTPAAAPATASASVKADDKNKPAPAARPAKAAELTPEEKKAEEAAKAKKARCDKLKDELGYNAAQQRPGGSQITMDRLAGERKQIDAALKKEGCTG